MHVVETLAGLVPQVTDPVVGYSLLPHVLFRVGGWRGGRSCVRFFRFYTLPYIILIFILIFIIIIIMLSKKSICFVCFRLLSKKSTCFVCLALLRLLGKRSICFCAVLVGHVLAHRTLVGGHGGLPLRHSSLTSCLRPLADHALITLVIVIQFPLDKGECHLSQRFHLDDLARPHVL